MDIYLHFKDRKLRLSEPNTLPKILFLVDSWVRFYLNLFILSPEPMLLNDSILCCVYQNLRSGGKTVTLRFLLQKALMPQ